MIKPDPPASLADTREAVERLDARGETVTPVDHEQVRGSIRDLVESGVESLTVASSTRTSRPPRAGDRCARRGALPGFPVTLSSRGAARVPRVRAHADRVHELLRPPARRQLRRPTCRRTSQARPRRRHQHPPLRRRHHDAARGGAEPGLRGPLGPVGGVAGALYVASRAGYPNILTFDMGGTSTDVSLCRDGVTSIGRETRIGLFRIKSRRSTSTPSAPAAVRSPTSRS